MGASRRSSEDAGGSSTEGEETVSEAADSRGCSTIGASAKEGPLPESDSSSLRADFRDPLKEKKSRSMQVICKYDA